MREALNGSGHSPRTPQATTAGDDRLATTDGPEHTTSVCGPCVAHLYHALMSVCLSTSCRRYPAGLTVAARSAALLSFQPELRSSSLRSAAAADNSSDPPTVRPSALTDRHFLVPPPQPP